MNWENIEGLWRQLRSQVETQWAKFTNDEAIVVTVDAQPLHTATRESDVAPKDDAARRVDTHLESSRTTSEGEPMQHHYATISLLTLFTVATGCAGSMPAPTERLASAQSATRSAVELGAEQHPAARLSLKRARDQVAEAQAAMAKDENEAANSLLLRAKADAELAVAQTRENTANLGVQAARDDSEAQKAMNVQQGAAK